MRRKLTKEKLLEAENAALREAIEEALADLSDDECSAGIRILSAKLTLDGAGRREEEQIREYLRPIKNRKK